MASDVVKRFEMAKSGFLSPVRLPFRQAASSKGGQHHSIPTEA
jgi:hypothetical protein